MSTIIRYMFFALALVLLYYVGKTIYNDNTSSEPEVSVIASKN